MNSMTIKKLDNGNISVDFKFELDEKKQIAFQQVEQMKQKIVSKFPPSVYIRFEQKPTNTLSNLSVTFSDVTVEEIKTALFKDFPFVFVKA